MSCFSFHGMAERETRCRSSVRYCKRWSEWLKSTLTRPGREFGGRVGSNPTTMCNLMIILWGCRKKDLQGISNPSHAGSSPVSPTICDIFNLMPWYSSNWSGSNSELDALSIRMMRGPMKRQWSRYPQYRHQFFSLQDLFVWYNWICPSMKQSEQGYTLKKTESGIRRRRSMTTWSLYRSKSMRTLKGCWSVPYNRRRLADKADFAFSGP